MHKLDPIERLPDGSLFRLTPGQLRKALLQLLGWRLPAAGRCLPAVHFSKSTLPLVSPRRAAPAAQAGTGHSQPGKTPPLRSLRQEHPRPLRQDKILPLLCQGGSPPAEGKIRP